MISLKAMIKSMLQSMINLMSNQAAGFPCQQQLRKQQWQGLGLFRQAVIAWVAGLAVATCSLLTPLPAMASANLVASGSNGLVAMPAMATLSVVASLSGKAKATAKDTEGKLESAYGDLTGDKGR